MRLRPIVVLTVHAPKFLLRYRITPSDRKGFTTTNQASIRGNVGRSPTIRFIERTKGKVAPQSKQDVSQLWPIEILEAASRSGRLGVSCTEAIRILDYFKALGRAPRESEAKKLCEEHNIGSRDLIALSRVLGRSHKLHFSAIVLNLIHAAGHLKDRLATIAQAQMAIKSKTILTTDHDNVRKRVEELAKTNDPIGLYLLGIIHVFRKDRKTALDYWEKARAVLKSSPSEEGDLNEDFGDLFKHIAVEKWLMEDHNGAQDVLEEGALKYDYPASYYHLANWYRPVTSSTWLEYMLKAAASGHTEAAHKLGLYYTGQALGLVPIPETHRQDLGVIRFHHKNSINDIATRELYIVSEKLQQQTLARALEWVTIGAQSGVLRCKIILAIYLRAKGEHEKGFKWLTGANEDQHWQTLVPFYMEHWYNKDIDFVWGSDNPSAAENSYSLKRIVSAELTMPQVLQKEKTTKIRF